MSDSGFLIFGVTAGLATLALFVYALILVRRELHSKRGAAPDHAGPAPPAPTAQDPDSPAGAARGSTSRESPAMTEEPLPRAGFVPHLGTAPIASIMRNEATGRLQVEVAGRKFASATALKESRHWEMVQSLVHELNGWISQVDEPATSTDTTHATEAERPESMVEAINRILQKMTHDAKSGPKAVRLVEEPGGSVKVLVGLHSYEPQEITDPEIRRLIREAVAEWEESQ